MASIVPYHGEFLINPVPLEMSLGVCSHGCQYCFATAKPQGDRETQKQVESTIRWLATYHDKHSLEAQLLQKGYPVVVSNRADPFSRAGFTFVSANIKHLQGVNYANRRWYHRKGKEAQNGRRPKQVNSSR
jgi:hypothetical protein